MLIEFTPEEQRQIEAIQTKYAPEREALGRELLEVASGDNPKRLKEITDRQQIIYDTMTAEIDAYSEKCQKKRFKKIAEGGTEAILDDAREEAPELIELLYNNTLQYWGKITKDDEEKDLSLYSFKGGKLYLKQAYALEMLKTELHFHIEALAEDQDFFPVLFSIFRYAIDHSPYTDEEQPTEIELKAIKREKRPPFPSIKTYGLLNDKAYTHIMRENALPISEQKLDGQYRFIFQIDQKTKEQVQTLICLDFEGEELTKKLTSYDSAVYNAVSNLYHHWEQINPGMPLDITVAEVWRHMNGKLLQDKNARPSKAQAEKIARSIGKMRHTDFIMNLQQEIEHGMIDISDLGDRANGFYIKDYLLNAVEWGVTTPNGNLACGFRINKEPILHYYNKKKNHILYLPLDLLDTSEALSDSEYVTEFKQYLLQQIVLMKNNARKSNRILLSTLYEATGIKAPEERINTRSYNSEETLKANIRKQKKYDRDKIEKLLGAWIKKDWIKGFKPIKEGKEIVSYDIIFKAPSPKKIDGKSGTP